MAGVLAAVFGLGTASALGWPWWLRFSTVLIAVVFVVLAFRRREVARFLRPYFGERFERFLAEPHGTGTKGTCISIALAGVGVCLVWYVSGGGQWALAGLCIALGTLAFYWGSKICPMAVSPKRAGAGIAIGGFLLSLSANFLAGAAAGQTSLDTSIAAMSGNINTLLGRTEAIKEDTERLRKDAEDIKAAQVDLARQMAEFRKEVLAAVAPKAGEDPTARTYSPKVEAAADVLSKSKLALDRAIAAIVGKDWATWRAEIKTALDAAGSAEEVMEAKRVEGDGYYAQGMFDEAIGPYEVAFRLREGDVSARNNLAISLNSARRGDMAARQRRAIEIYEGTLKLPGLSRADWAMTQNNLGIAWGDMPTGDRATNLAKAVAAYEAALTIYTRDDAPFDWAMTQTNLGSAWWGMPTGDKGANLAKAIAAYESALTVYTKDASPLEWAVTQNNLGIAWWGMPTGDKGANLAKAIAAYEAALTVRTKEAAPLDWAGTQNNLGIAWGNMPTGDKAANLTKAIAAYESALTVRTRDAAPLDWAATQNNLGAAWQDMPTGDKAANLTKAIAAYESALTVRTKDTAPLDWAVTQNNLGITWAEMPAGDKGANLAKAIAAYESALTVRTKDAAPPEWAMTQYNLANALADLTEMSPLPGQDRCGLLRRSIACSKGALTVRTPEAFPREHARTNRNMAIYRRRYEELGCHTGNGGIPFDDIPPAR